MSEVNMKTFFHGKTFSLQGRVFYPKILAPEAKNPGDRLKYNCLFAWKFGSNAQVTQEIGAFLAQSKQTFWPTVPELYFINPVKKWGVYQRQDGKPTAEFLKDSYWLNAASGADFPPVVVDSQRNPIIDPALVYSGMNAVINVAFYAINNEKKGVGVNLNAIMALPGGEKEGGVPQVDVNRVFGDFAADMGMGTTPPATPPATTLQATQQQGQQWPPQTPSTNGFM